MLFTSDRRLLADEALFAFLEGRPELPPGAHPQVQQQQQQQQQQQRGPHAAGEGDAIAAAAAGGGTAFSWIGEGAVGVGDNNDSYLSLDGSDEFPRIHTPEDDAVGRGGPQQQMQTQQQQQQHDRYQPMNVHPAPDVPGRGMVAMPIASQQGEPPARMMPIASGHAYSAPSSGGGGELSSLENMQAAREQDLGLWTRRDAKA